jgi:hypothetical protein
MQESARAACRLEWFDAYNCPNIAWTSTSGDPLTPAIMKMFVSRARYIVIHSIRRAYHVRTTKLQLNLVYELYAFTTWLAETDQHLSVRTPDRQCVARLEITTTHGIDSATWQIIRESNVECLCFGTDDGISDEHLYAMFWDVARIVRETPSLRELHVVFDRHRLGSPGAPDFLTHAMRRLLLAIAASSSLRYTTIQPWHTWTIDATHLACVSGATCQMYVYAGPDKHIPELKQIAWPVAASPSPSQSPPFPAPKSLACMIRVEKGCISKNVACWPPDHAELFPVYKPIVAAHRLAVRIDLHEHMAEGPWSEQMVATNELVVVCPGVTNATTEPVFSAKNMYRLVAMAPVADTWIFIGEHSMHSLPLTIIKARTTQ